MMADNAYKSPLAFTLRSYLERRTDDAAQLQSFGLPCHVLDVVSSGIVDVHFDVLNNVYTLPTTRMAVAMSEYGRVPIQKGDKGAAITFDAYLGGVTGLGGGTADLTRRANLTPLLFCPCANTGFFAVDLNAYVIYGPNGVVLMDKGARTVLTLTPNGITITTPGDVTINGIHFSTHEHSGVVTGGSNTGPPVPGS